MTNETRQRLIDVKVLVSCQAIREYTAGLDFAAYEREAMVRDAVSRGPVCRCPTATPSWRKTRVTRGERVGGTVGGGDREWWLCHVR